MNLSFVIPAYNEAMYIGECLDSVLHYAAGRHHEIIVIDNGSTDRTSDIAKSRPGVRVVYEGSRGITHARQRGLQEATGELIAYIDADTRISPSWLNIAEQSFHDDSKLICLSGPYHYYDGAFIARWFSNLISLAALPIGHLCFGFMLVGGNYIVRRSALISAGGFDRRIDFFGEDTDIGRRLYLGGRNLGGRMHFRYDFFIYSSARRFYAEGIFRANAVYLLNYLWVIYFHRPFSTCHRDIRFLYPAKGSRLVRDFIESLANTSSHFFATIFRTLPGKVSLMLREIKRIATSDPIE
jgi:glycosyltransferase involved in cell wall biosynthesis